MRPSLLILAAAFAAAAPAAPRDGHDGKIDFIHDTEFGLAKAKLEGKATMLFFTADW
jgi:hypothetical protein